MNESQDHTGHWEEKFKTRAWGRYPPEDLVRFMGRNFKTADKAAVHVLEVGCGPGANVWFLHREGYAVSALDVSPTAIELTRERLKRENKDAGSPEPDLQLGNFEELPWPDQRFDVVIDIFALYANPVNVIDQALSQIARVLKPGGLFYTKLWGTQTTGYGTGTSIEPGTFSDIPSGPCHNMGVSHFFDRDEITRVFGRHFEPVAVDRVMRTDGAAGQNLEEFQCQFRKAP